MRGSSNSYCAIIEGEDNDVSKETRKDTYNVNFITKKLNKMCSNVNKVFIFLI